MERTIAVQHICLEIAADFDSFTQRIEQLLGRFDYSSYRHMESDPQMVEKRLKEWEGEQGLMLFNIQEHGKLLRLAGMQRKAKQYVLGNPLIALTMTQQDIRAGLYAPLRMFVYEDEKHSTKVEYDQPSSLFGHFDNSQVLAVGRSLDAKILNLIRKAESEAEIGSATPKQ